MNDKIITFTTLIIIFGILLIAITMVFNSIPQQPCTQLINVCSYQHWMGKHYKTEYVSCTSTQSEDIEQMCITNAPNVALIDFYNSKVGK
jgi:hypothetical protein